MSIITALKWLSGAAGVAFVLYLLAIAWTLNAYRFKVIDPKDPGFKAENFRFEDYFLDESVDRNKVLDAMFPPGTGRAYVESILVDRAGATSSDYSDYLPEERFPDAKSYVHYDCEPWWNPAYKIFGLLNGVMFDGAHFVVRIYYDEHNKVLGRS